MDQTDFGPIPEGHSQADFIKDLNFGDIELDDPLTKAALEDHPKDEWIDILGNGQLRKKTISKGKKGFRPSRYDLCTLKISGELLDSRKVVEEHKEMTIQVGDVEVIQGLDLAIILMEVGEIAEIEVASRFAYGEIGLPPDVPPGATLLYTVELISLDMETQMEDLHFQQRRNIGCVTVYGDSLLLSLFYSSLNFFTLESRNASVVTGGLLVTNRLWLSSAIDALSTF